MVSVRFFSFVALLCLIAPALNAQHKIIYLIAPPRSMSTAFLRMMDARNDFAIINEPSQAAWHSAEGHAFANNWYDKKAGKTFEQVKARIYQQAAKSDVFVKEMSYAVHQFLLHDKEFTSNPNVQFVFLVRNPHDIILSYYRKMSDNDFKMFNFSELVGGRASYEIYEHLKQHGVRTPCIVVAEDIYGNPDKAIREYCAAVDIPHKPEALHWEKLGKDFSGKQEWGEIKGQNATQNWHDAVLQSTGFGTPAQNKVDAQGRPTFEEVKDALKSICRDAYNTNMDYYIRMLEEKAAGAR